MPIPFPEYAAIKDECCICYFGNHAELMIQLKYLRPRIEEAGPGINIHLCVKSDFADMLAGEKNILFMHNILENKKRFAYLKEILFDMNTHPIQALLEESEIKINKFKPIKTGNKKAIILSKGQPPTRSLSEEEVAKLKKSLQNKGYEVIDGNWKDAGIVAGVECSNLYEAAFNQVPTILIPTGIGTEFYHTVIEGNVLKLS